MNILPFMGGGIFSATFFQNTYTENCQLEDFGL
ncbi:Uncharacterised protein [Chlamydia trachomatis]|nr:Uncharacterised protein [Chlamydia trachomatis]